ncbi:MAG TPA: 50S ribosomal protein L6 [Saprospiraceae bacterium]|nr:50S ribosomal protein L6 [Saprospiraceae bacterium]
MSRIGKAPIELASGVQIEVSKGNLVKVKGPKGELYQQIDPDLTVKVEDNNIVVERPTDQKRHRSIHGLYRSLINNMVIGVSTGYKKELELVGVGYRVNNTGNLLEITVGYSHPIYFYIPDEIKVSTLMEKGKNPSIILEGIDKQLIGQVAAKIRSFRKPEPYKGKGIKYSDEIIRRKAGKTAKK